MKIGTIDIGDRADVQRGSISDRRPGFALYADTVLARSCRCRRRLDRDLEVSLTRMTCSRSS